MRVTCASCDKSVCRDCGKRYILDIDDPACMYCKHPWNREFLQTNFTKYFREGELKKKREDVLLGIEEAMLPATQHLAALERERRQVADDQKRVAAELREALKRVADLRNEYSTLGNRSWFLQRRIETGDANGDQEQERSEKRAFIKHCPANGCNGFLTTQYRCGLCDMRVCNKCLEEKLPDVEHVCNPDQVATVDFLMKDTRPCPKCAAPIHKIDGCSQMWCVQCHTAFDWRTGRIESGHIHNPHWYEYQRRVNNGAIPREPGDAPGGGCCNQDAELPRFYRVDLNKRTRELEGVHRWLIHIHATQLRDRRNQDEEHAKEKRNLRIKYLLSEIDKEKWKKQLQQREKKHDKATAIRQVYEIIYHGSVDIFTRLVASREYTGAQALTELETLRVYANTCFDDVCKRFSCTFDIRIKDSFEPEQVSHTKKRAATAAAKK